MAKPRPTFLKRQRERKLNEKRAEKMRRREDRKREKAMAGDDPTAGVDIDPDLIGLFDDLEDGVPPGFGDVAREHMKKEAEVRAQNEDEEEEFDEEEEAF